MGPQLVGPKKLDFFRTFLGIKGVAGLSFVALVLTLCEKVTLTNIKA